MERVSGIGGIFFKSEDVASLKAWYVANLGVPEDGVFASSAGGEQTVWAPFKKDTTYFAPSTKPYMVNFRVRDLDAMLAQLRAAGCAVEEKVESSEYGRFGWVLDPEGTRIELWEPPPAK